LNIAEDKKTIMKIARNYAEKHAEADIPEGVGMYVYVPGCTEGRS
jgi:hypothetical protein